MLRFLKSFFRSLRVFIASIPFLYKHKLWIFLLYPLLLFVCFYVLAFFGLASLADYVKELFLNFDWIRNIPENGHFFSFIKKIPDGVIGLLFQLVFKIIFWWIGTTFLKYITLIFLSPILSLLSEKVEEKITGRHFPFLFRQFIRDLLRGLFINLRNMIIEYTLILVCFVIGFLFPASLLLSVPFLVMVSWYFFGFSIIDYSLERHKYSKKESIKFVRKNAGIACGIGFCYWLLSTLPSVLGYLSAIAVAPVLATIASVVLYIEYGEGKK